MSTWRIALLRGINVGKAKRIAMADLRELFEELGYADVRTLLNSGNVVFTAKGVKGDHAARIEKGIEEKLGVTSRVIVLTGAELAKVIEQNPLLDVADNPSRMVVDVLDKKADRAKLDPLAKEDWGLEVLALGDLAAYMWCPSGINQSKLVMAVGRALRDKGTTRNWGTILKLHEITK